MSRIKEFELTKDQILFRRKIVFRTMLHESLWKMSMKFAGYHIREYKREP